MFLKNNGYPNALISKNFQKNRSKNSSQVSEKIVYASVPYIKGASERFSKIMKKYNIKIAHLPR